MPHGKTNDSVKRNSVNKMFHYLEPYIITGNIAFFFPSIFLALQKVLSRNNCFNL